MISWSMEAYDPRLLPAMLAALSPDERRRCDAFRVEKRRADWLLGRWTAKRLVRAVWRADSGEWRSLESIVIARLPSGAVALPDFPGWRLSISHSAGRAFCALGEQAMLGADLERIVPRAPGFAADYFTTAERALTAAADAAHRDLMTTAIWCGKEAALKALGLGLTVDTRTVACLGAVPTADAWTRFTIALEESIPIPGSGAAPALLGWWRRLDDFVLTLAADRAVAPT